MNNIKTSNLSRLSLMPLVGCALFAVLYVVATLYYPGGSPIDKNTIGFSWRDSYWCNLLNETALNGQPNAARPIAFTAMGILVFSLIAFWMLFPLQAGFKRGPRLLMQVSGCLAMGIGVFLFTGYHDMVINVATLFGLVALAGTLIGLKKLGWTALFWMGVFNLVLIGLNNLCYYGKGLWTYLPVVQKVTFLYFLVWIGMVSWWMYRRGGGE